ncbi:MAG: hypothetical protein JWN53_1636 [Gemmatimonadetes bacterium]|jgi:hypothetical protein|nr:hypothetical protein [Gemmatimonadota bacterium]
MQLFTVEQANGTLPLVRRILEDVVRTHRLWEESMVELDLAATGHLAALPEARARQLERTIQGLAEELDGYQRELEALGIQLKDRRIGLIDFPSDMDGRTVLLCWRLGESSVQYWHDVQTGFAGRQPLSPTLVG